MKFVNLIHKHDSIYNTLTNDVAKAEYVTKNRKDIVDFVVYKVQDVTGWQATLNKLNVLEADSLINAEFLLTNINANDSILLHSSFPFDSLQLKRQIKPIKINDKVNISGVFISRDVVETYIIFILHLTSSVNTKPQGLIFTLRR